MRNNSTNHQKSIFSLCLMLMTALCFIGFGAQGVSAQVDLTSSWSSFRGNAQNNAVVDSLTPTVADDTCLYWAAKGAEGSDWTSGAPSSPIIVDNCLVFTAKNKIIKMDTVSGEIVATGDLAGTLGFNVTPPTYGDGMIFVTLNTGVEAFDAKTLKSLWVYHDPDQGQANCPISYNNGHVYTGFWQSETKSSIYVCIDTTDGDTANTKEEKTATWTYSHAGGFYWAGSFVCNDYLIVGTDNGSDKTTGHEQDPSDLVSLNPLTGAVLDTIPTIKGDIRSTVTYDLNSDRFYFTTKGGYLYSVKVDANGTFNDSSLKSVALGDFANYIPMSTSTPVIYNDRAYVGVSGVGQFDLYQGHNITVIDLTTWKIAYTCPTQGFPQTSGLLTTGYVDASGYVYVYFIDNYTPGKLRVIKDKAGQTSMISASSYAPILFTPANKQAQYAICSPISDDNGTLYFKNDAGYMMAIGSTIEKIEVTKQPDKTSYVEGEAFDPTGMKVTAYYSNGSTRDITDYVSYVNGFDAANNPIYVSADELTSTLSADDTEINVYFTYVAYQDTDNKDNTDDKDNVGVTVAKPYASIDLTVTDSSFQEEIDNVIALIDNLDGKISDNAVTVARTAYDKLTAAQKSKVTNYAALTAAETKIASKPFTDMQSVAWYYDAAYFAYYNGLIAGTSTTNFAPDTATTRGMLVTILYRYDGKPAVSGSTPFTDLTQDWYKDAVLWAYQNNIVYGQSATSFDPSTPVTREQLAAILYRYCGEYKKYDVTASTSLSAFPDAASVSGYATTAIQWAVAKGYISGTAEGGVSYLDPSGSATRAQVASIMMRFIKSL